MWSGRCFFSFPDWRRTGKAENRAGKSKIALANRRKNVRPGSSKPENCAGLLMERCVKVRFIKIGKKK